MPVPFRFFGADVYSDSVRPKGIPHYDATHEDYATLVVGGDWYPALAAAETDRAAAPSGPVMLPGRATAYEVHSNLTLGAYQPAPGAIVKPANTKTFSPTLVNPPLSQIFDESLGGAANPSGVPVFCPEWWGGGPTATPSANTAAAQAAYRACAAVGVGTVRYTTPGTWSFLITTNGTPAITIGGSNITTEIAPNVTLQPTVSSAVTSAAQERGQYLFTATGQSGLRFTGGGTFNGNRGGGTDPVAGFFKGVQCSDVEIDHFVFEDSSNSFGAVIRGDSWDGASSVALTNWKIHDNTVRRCTWWTNILNVWRNIQIADNHLANMDLSDIDGFSRYGSTAYARGIRLTGYVDATSADGDIGNVTITGNTIDVGSYFIEVWNQDATNGRNPDHAQTITVANNKGVALWGIGVNSFAKQAITGNTITRLLYSASDVAAWVAAGGYTQGTFTSSASSPGDAMIEARPGYDVNVSGNVVDGGWTAASPDLSGSVLGISIGEGNKNVRCEATVVGNRIVRCYYGVKADDCQQSVVRNNDFLACRNALFSARGTNSYGFKNNRFVGNTIVHHGYATASYGAVFYGDSWTIRDNHFESDPSVRITNAFVNLADTAMTAHLVNNRFFGFAGEAVLDAALESNYDGNTYDGGNSTTASYYGAVTFARQANKVARIGTEFLRRTTCAYAWTGAAASGELYLCNQVATPQILAHAHKQKSAGTIYAMAFHMGVVNVNAAPTTGYWAAGNRLEFQAPAAGGSLGAVCTTAGSALSVQLVAGANGVTFPNSATAVATTPNATANQIRDDIDIIVKCSLVDWTPTSQNSLVSKWMTGQFGYRFCVLGAGLNFAITTDGTTAIQATSSVIAPFADGTIGWVRVQRRKSDGRVQFFTSTDGITWTQLGTNQTVSSGNSAFASTAQMEVGRQNGANSLNGTIYYASIANALAGTPMVVFDPSSQSVGDTAWQASTGEAWTVSGTTAATWKTYGAIAA